MSADLTDLVASVERLLRTSPAAFLTNCLELLVRGLGRSGHRPAGIIGAAMARHDRFLLVLPCLCLLVSLVGF